jgi:hypothetical protein
MAPSAQVRGEDLGTAPARAGANGPKREAHRTERGEYWRPCHQERTPHAQTDLVRHL